MFCLHYQSLGYADGEPAIWPCNIKDCPYEYAEEQHTHNQIHHGSVGSGLGQIEF